MAQKACLALVGTRRWPKDQRMLCWGEPTGVSLQLVKSGHHRLTIANFTTTLARKWSNYDNLEQTWKIIKNKQMK